MTPADWRKCEGMHHEGNVHHETVEWRDLGLLCDDCYSATVDVRPLQDEMEVLRAELEVLRDLRARVVGFGGDDYTVMPWIDAHRLHTDDAPYIGCPFCRDRFVSVAEMETVRQAVTDLVATTDLRLAPRHVLDRLAQIIRREAVGP